MKTCTSELDRVRQAACRDKELKFTSLWHHVYDVDRLREAYLAIKRTRPRAWTDRRGRRTGRNLRATSRTSRTAWRRELPGQAGQTGVHPESRRQTTTHRRAGAGRQDRPAGDGAVLNAVYEADFLGFSYGFRPGASRTWRWTRWRWESGRGR